METNFILMAFKLDCNEYIAKKSYKSASAVPSGGKSLYKPQYTKMPNKRVGWANFFAYYMKNSGELDNVKT